MLLNSVSGLMLFLVNSFRLVEKNNYYWLIFGYEHVISFVIFVNC